MIFFDLLQCSINCLPFWIIIEWSSSPVFWNDLNDPCLICSFAVCSPPRCDVLDLSESALLIPFHSNYSHTISFKLLEWRWFEATQLESLLPCVVVYCLMQGKTFCSLFPIFAQHTVWSRQIWDFPENVVFVLQWQPIQE